MDQVCTSLSDAAIDVSAAIGVPVEREDLLELVTLGLLPAIAINDQGEPVLRHRELHRFAGRVRRLQGTGLFSSIEAIFGEQPRDNQQLSTVGYRNVDVISEGMLFVVLSPRLAISFDPTRVEMDKVQLLIAGIRDGYTHKRNLENPGQTGSKGLSWIDLDNNVTVWALDQIDQAALAHLWEDAVCRDAVTRYAESLSIPRIYGNKSKITSFLTAVAKRYVPQGGAVCDLMSGTGVVTRQFARFFDMYANDANPFAALITRQQILVHPPPELVPIVEKIKPLYEKNRKALEELLSSYVESEAHFLHSEVTPEALNAYRQFCADTPACYGDLSGNEDRLAQMVKKRRLEADLFPYCLATTYYSNAYFGLSQCIAIDSLRFAIDQCTEGEVHDFCLATLLLVACSCASGPHFAQPPKILSQSAMAEIVEHRAREVLSEYMVALRILSERDNRPLTIKKVWNHDWRVALEEFAVVAKDYEKGAVAVYIDPPYSKLQYSRYYHVLNTLVKYDYPVCCGVGRYPARSRRFSSKFEYQRSSAKREFVDLFNRCAELGFTILMSYSNRGLVPLDELVRGMESCFGKVEIFSKPSRHSSQGTKFIEGRQNVTEYVLVGAR